MRKYRLSFEYCYTHYYQEEFTASNKEEARETAREILSNIASPITGQIELIELGEIIELGEDIIVS